MSISVLVCGSGSIGSRHIQNLKTLGVNVSVWRSRPELLESVCKQYQINGFISLEQALTSTDAVVVASATDTHLEIALKAAMAGKPIYLEKPISHNLEGVENFKEIVKRQKLVVEVGCQLRTHPNLKYLAKEIKRERFAHFTHSGPQ